MLILKNLVFSLTLIYAGYVDIKRRIIPNKVHVIIIISSLFYGFNFAQSLIGFFLLPIPFIVAVLFDENSVGGGDIKRATRFSISV